MKTRLKLFDENLTQDEFNRAFDYTKNHWHSLGMDVFNMKYPNFSESIKSAFVFSDTEEGHSYWHNISKRKSIPSEETEDVATNDTYVDSKFMIDKMLAFNEIIGLAQGYFDVIIEYPERAQEIAQNALEVIDLKYNETKRYAKRNN